jgi:hypothetical protein
VNCLNHGRKQVSFLFENKAPKEIVEAISRLASEDQTRAQFEALASLDAQTRDIVINDLEEYIIGFANSLRKSINKRGLADAKGLWMEKTKLGPAYVPDEEQALAELVRQVAKIKGAAARPLIKAYAQEISKLSEAQYNTENMIYGAAFDALGKVMPSNGPFANKAEEQRIIDLGEALNWRFTVGVKEHFNKAGKYAEFVTEATGTETRAQRGDIKKIFLNLDSEAEASLAYLRATEVFMGVARRVGNDTELANLLPASKLTAEDATILEKHKLESLATLVKAALQNKPK